MIPTRDVVVNKLEGAVVERKPPKRRVETREFVWVCFIDKSLKQPNKHKHTLWMIISCPRGAVVTALCVCVCVYTPVTLLHDGDLLDDLLKVRLHRNLFDGDDIARLLVVGFEHGAVRPADTHTHTEIQVDWSAVCLSAGNGMNTTIIMWFLSCE